MIVPTLILEERLWKKGMQHVVGVDEAGKGPLAGPVTAGAVLLHHADQVVSGVRDSKLMTRLQREKAYKEICTKSSAWGVGIVEAKEIDRIGIQEAVRKAMLLALSQLEKSFGEAISYVLVDGSKTTPLKKYPSMRILKGGLYHYTIAAGSILAKVTRDRIMHEMAEKYPLYNFAHHVGYGTPEHLQLLSTHGPCPIHRQSFAPLKKV